MKHQACYGAIWVVWVMTGPKWISAHPNKVSLRFCSCTWPERAREYLVCSRKPRGIGIKRDTISWQKWRMLATNHNRSECAVTVVCPWGEMFLVMMVYTSQSRVLLWWGAQLSRITITRWDSKTLRRRSSLLMKRWWSLIHCQWCSDRSCHCHPDTRIPIIWYTSTGSRLLETGHHIISI